VPAGARFTGPDDMKKIVDLVAPMIGVDPRDFAAMVLVIGDAHGQVAIVAGRASAMAIVSLLSQGIDRIAATEIEAMGLLQ
jgi:hypothetical protein